MGLFRNNGIYLEQNKRPAIDRDIRSLKEEGEESTAEKRSNPSLLAPHEIVIIAKEANVVDETDGLYLWDKLTNAVEEGITTIVVDAMDDEPYISSQVILLMRRPEELAEGIGLAARAIGTTDVKIEVYRNLLDDDIKLPRKLGSIKVERVGGRYPAEFSDKRQHKRGKVLTIGACALMHLREAVYNNTPHDSCYVTVAGDCISNPGNYIIPVGMMVADILQKVGTISDPKRLVVGGSMTGVAIWEQSDVKISHTTRAILAFSTTFTEKKTGCIGCGRCVHACPKGLSPYYIYKLSKGRLKHRLKTTDVQLCDGCGSCSYVCPAKLELAHICRSINRSINYAQKNLD